MYDHASPVYKVHHIVRGFDFDLRGRDAHARRR
jgi:hypothetical protein